MYVYKYLYEEEKNGVCSPNINFLSSSVLFWWIFSIAG